MQQKYIFIEFFILAEGYMWDEIPKEEIPKDWFTIDTPLGKHNPDWAIIMNEEGKEKLYFVVETKGSGTFYDSVHCVDVVITDESGKVVRRYQSKYCKDAEATAKAFEHGDYRGHGNSFGKRNLCNGSCDYR